MLVLAAVNFLNFICIIYVWFFFYIFLSSCSSSTLNLSSLFTSMAFSELSSILWTLNFNVHILLFYLVCCLNNTIFFVIFYLIFCAAFKIVWFPYFNFMRAEFAPSKWVFFLPFFFIANTLLHDAHLDLSWANFSLQWAFHCSLLYCVRLFVYFHVVSFSWISYFHNNFFILSINVFLVALISVIFFILGVSSASWET